MNKVDYIEKSMQGWKPEENPYTHDFIEMVFDLLGQLQPDNFQDRLINRHLYARAASLLSWVVKDRLQYTMFGVVQGVELKKYSSRPFFKKKLCNHPAYSTFTCTKPAHA